MLQARYRVLVSEDALRADGYLAGSDERRADELNGFLRNPDVRAIFVGRGGYGIMRIVDRLDGTALEADPKPIVGFSDATALLAWAVTAARVRPIHGPVVTQLADLSSGDASWLFRLLERVETAGDVVGTGGAGEFAGALVGGNLAMVSHLLGTPWAWRTGGAVLLLEDLGERPYQVDRYITHLHLAGALTDVAGLALGDFVRCDEPTGAPSPRTTSEVLSERLETLRIPSVRGLPIGHGSSNRAVPMGAQCEVVGGRLILTEPAVR